MRSVDDVLQPLDALLKSLVLLVEIESLIEEHLGQVRLKLSRFEVVRDVPKYWCRYLRAVAVSPAGHDDQLAPLRHKEGDRFVGKAPHLLAGARPVGAVLTVTQVDERLSGERTPHLAPDLVSHKCLWRNIV